MDHSIPHHFDIHPVIPMPDPVADAADIAPGQVGAETLHADDRLLDGNAQSGDMDLDAFREDLRENRRQASRRLRISTIIAKLREHETELKAGTFTARHPGRPVAAKASREAELAF